MAKNYPGREITMLVGFNAGGATDLVARALAKPMEKALGQPIVVLNKPGAGGLLALNEIVRSKPDGYTLMFSSPTPLVAKHVEKNAPTVKDLEVIAVVNRDASAILVKSDSPFKTLKEFFETAKEHPNTITMAHAGVNGGYYLNALVWQLFTGARFKLVPYHGGAQEYPAVAGGHVMSASGVLPEAKALIDSGKIRGLGVAAEERYPDFPDVPTFKEQGYDLVWGQVKFLVAPKGTPMDVIQKLGDAVDAAIKSPEMKAFWKSSGFGYFYLKRDAAIKYLNNAEVTIDKALKD